MARMVIKANKGNNIFCMDKGKDATCEKQIWLWQQTQRLFFSCWVGARADRQMSTHIIDCQEKPLVKSRHDVWFYGKSPVDSTFSKSVLFYFTNADIFFKNNRAVQKGKRK